MRVRLFAWIVIVGSPVLGGCGSNAVGMLDGQDAGKPEEVADGSDADSTAADDSGSFKEGEGGTDGAGASCAQADAKPNRIPGTVWLVVDVSDIEASGDYAGILGVNAPPNQTYLGTLRAALLGPGGLIEKFQSVEAFGFVGVDCGLPLNCDDESCTVPDAATSELQWCPDLHVAAPALANEGAIAMAFPSQVMGDVPATYHGLEYVLEHLPAAADVMTHPQAVVLAFRGANETLCGNETNLPPDVLDAGIASGATPAQALSAVSYISQQIVDRGAKIFVLNNGETAPGALQAQQTIARIGNTGFAPFSPQSVGDLENALTGAFTQAVSCDVSLTGTVVRGDECLGQVAIDGTSIVCNDPNGWRLKDSSTVEFVGAACAMLRANADAHVSATFPCDAFVVPK